jgi:hypothetical protein
VIILAGALLFAAGMFSLHVCGLVVEDRLGAAEKTRQRLSSMTRSPLAGLSLGDTETSTPKHESSTDGLGVPLMDAAGDGSPSFGDNAPRSRSGSQNPSVSGRSGIWAVLNRFNFDFSSRFIRMCAYFRLVRVFVDEEGAIYAGSSGKPEFKKNLRSPYSPPSLNTTY